MVLFPSRRLFDEKSQPGFYFPFLANLREGQTPRSVFRLLRNSPEGPHLLFESTRRDERFGRYSYVLSHPFMRFRSWGRHLQVNAGDSQTERTGDPFEALRALLAEHRMGPGVAPVPFAGGCAGVLAFELKNQIEAFQGDLEDPYGLPDMDLGFYDRGVAFDHVLNKGYAFAALRPEEGGYETGVRKVLQWASSVSRAVPSSETELELGAWDLGSNVRSFTQAVKKAKAHIRRGDIFQVNLSHCLSFDFSGDPFGCYETQTRINPTAFSGFADFGDTVLLCGSPERLVKLSRGEVSTRPIAGTRPRSIHPELDRGFAKDLLLSPKERAEHVMLVDLERNDLGRVCAFGSVRVNDFMVLEDYSHVRHIVSEVTGRLTRENDAVDLLRSVFPGGTITGAPKVRAMELIDELEGRARGFYTGSLGMLGFNGDCDWNIIIRSLILKGGRAHLQVGAGIVADSHPDREYQETLDKARAMLHTLTAHKKRSGQTQNVF